MNDPAIYIPTFRRIDNQVTWSYLSDFWKSRASLVAVPEEVEPLRERGYTVLECPARGIGPTRQWIMDQHEGQYVFMFDDDLRFFKRRSDDPTKFRPKNEMAERTWMFSDMMLDLIGLLVQYPLIGLAGRGGANRVTDDVRINTRMHDMFGVDLDVTREHGFRIDRVEFMEDFDFILQHLTAGYDVACLNSYVKYDYSVREGGCSEYRDDTGQTAAALDLSLLWPDFVKPRQVKSKSYEGMWGSRTDVTVQWGKAAKSGKVLASE
jgi:hypothetical protein